VIEIMSNKSDNIGYKASLNTGIFGGYTYDTFSDNDAKVDVSDDTAFMDEIMYKPSLNNGVFGGYLYVNDIINDETLNDDIKDDRKNDASMNELNLKWKNVLYNDTEYYTASEQQEFNPKLRDINCKIDSLNKKVRYLTKKLSEIEGYNKILNKPVIYYKIKSINCILLYIYNDANINDSISEYEIEYISLPKNITINKNMNELNILTKLYENDDEKEVETTKISLKYVKNKRFQKYNITNIDNRLHYMITVNAKNKYNISPKSYIISNPFVSDILKDPKELIDIMTNELNKNFNLKRVYSRRIDGDKANIFHSRCGNIGENITLIQAKNGAIFGGYSTLSWKSKGRYTPDKNSFLFSIKPNINVFIPKNGAFGCIYYDNQYLMAYGYAFNTECSPALFVSDNVKKNMVKPDKYYISKGNKILSGKDNSQEYMYFDIKNFEVFVLK